MSSTSIPLRAPFALRVRAVGQLLADYAGGVFAMVRRDAVALMSYRFRLYTHLGGSLVTVVVFYYISRLVTQSKIGTSDDYFAYAVVGLVIFSVLASTLSMMPGRVRQELAAGTFERLLVSPLGATAAVAGMTIFPFFMALMQGTVTIIFAALVFGMPIHLATAPLAIPVALLGTSAFIPFALFIVAAVLAVKQAEAGVGIVMTGILLVGGFFFPVYLLPWWIRWTNEVQPFSPSLELLRHLLVGSAMTESIWLSLFKIGTCAVVMLPLSIWSVALALRYGQRRGTVTEY